MSNQLTVCEQMVWGAEQAFNDIAQSEGNLVIYKKEAMFAIQTLQNSSYLQGVEPQSIQNAVINVASVGLSLNPATQFAYLVPRDGKCCLDISYKGMMKIATDTGSVMWAKAELVRDGDTFQHNGFDQLPTHKFNPFEKGRNDISKVIGAYCVAKLHDSTYMVEMMSREELDKVRNTSKAGNGPWKTWPEEMMKKTIIKRAYKSWPKTSQRMAEALHIVNEHEGLDLSNNSTQHDVLPAYPVDQFEERFKNYEEWIRSGTRTKEEVINTLKTRFTLSEDQLNSINNVEIIDGNEQ